MNSEERVVRPYIGVDRVARAVDSFSLVVGDEVLSPGARATLPVDTYLTTAVSLAFAGDGAPLDDVRQQLLDGIAETKLDPADLDLLVVVSTPRLRLSEIRWRLSCDELKTLPSGIVLASAAERPLALQTPFGGSRIDVVVVLRQQLPKTVLRPWRKGTWLGRCEFFVVSDIGEIGFTPIPLNDETRQRLGLGKSTNRFVRIDASVLEPDVDEEALELYVDEDLLGQLAQFPRTPGSRSFQRQLFVDAATAIVLEAVRDPALDDLTISDAEHSLLDRLIDVAAGSLPGESKAARRARKGQLLEEIRTQPGNFVARLEGSADTKADLGAALTGADA